MSFNSNNENNENNEEFAKNISGINSPNRLTININENQKLSRNKDTKIMDNLSVMSLHHKQKTL